MPFSRYPSGSCPCQVSLPFELRHFPAGSLSPLSRIEFVSYRLVVLLRLLPTPPHDDAVAVEYGPENVCPVGTFTLLFKCAYERTGRTLRGPNKATKEIGTPVTAQQRGSCRRKRDNQRKPCGPPGTLERWNLNVGGALARRPAIVNVTTRQSRPEAPPTLAAYPLWILEFLGTLERRKES